MGVELGVEWLSSFVAKSIGVDEPTTVMSDSTYSKDYNKS